MPAKGTSGNTEQEDHFILTLLSLKPRSWTQVVFRTGHGILESLLHLATAMCRLVFVSGFTAASRDLNTSFHLLSRNVDHKWIQRSLGSLEERISSRPGSSYITSCQTHRAPSFLLSSNMLMYPSRRDSVGEIQWPSLTQGRKGKRSGKRLLLMGVKCSNFSEGR
jgi:hypothetical protein